MRFESQNLLQSGGGTHLRNPAGFERPASAPPTYEYTCMYPEGPVLGT